MTIGTKPGTSKPGKTSPKKPGGLADSVQEQGGEGGADRYELDVVDRKLLNHIMEYPDTSWADLAKATGVSASTAKVRYKKPAFQKALKEITAKTWDIIERAQNVAARTLLKLARDPDKRIALEASKYLLSPMLNKSQLEVKQVQEMIYRTRFGEDGKVISESEEVAIDAPKSTMDILEGVIDVDASAVPETKTDGPDAGAPEAP